MDIYEMDDERPSNLDQLVAHLQRNLNALAAEVVALKVEVAQLKALNIPPQISAGAIGNSEKSLGAMRLG
jgi:hypothetical protein